MLDRCQRFFGNARIVLADEIIDGWVETADGRIVQVGRGPAPGPALDCGRDTLMPGLVELHTDHLEQHYLPRPHVRWPMPAAILAYDAQISCAGITTVFDSFRLGGHDVFDIAADALPLAEAIASAQADGRLRASHFTHLRCEVATADVVDGAEAFLRARPAHLLSLMDHTPGQRQFRDFNKARGYFTKLGVATEADWARLVESRTALHARWSGRNRRALVALARDRGIAIASHDDATAGEVAEAIADGVAIAEFPTTIEAAAASHAASIAVLMGAPNIVRGGSHAGNVAAEALAGCGALDILSSDYVPNSLLLAAFALPRLVPGFDLPRAVRLVTKNPAKAAGLDDRGEIAPGRRADLILVRVAPDAPVLRAVWRDGSRVV